MQESSKWNYIQDIKLSENEDKFFILIEFIPETGNRNMQQPEIFHHQIIQDMTFSFQNTTLKITFGKNEIRDINPYCILLKIIEKINSMFLFYNIHKETLRLQPIIKKVNFNWICMDLELQFFEKSSSSSQQSQQQVQLQDQFKGRLSNILFVNIYDEINSKMQEDEQNSYFHLQIIKKIDKVLLRLPPDFDDEETYFMNIIYAIHENFAVHLEQVCVFLYLLYQDSNRGIFQEQKDNNLDLYIVSKCIKYLPQNKTVCMNIMRINYHQDPQKEYFEDIEFNPMILYKNMPFTLLFNLAECKECHDFNKNLGQLMGKKNQLQMMLQQSISNKDEINNEIEKIKKSILNQKGSIQTHTRQIEIQINVYQNIFQNNLQYNDNILDEIYKYLKSVQSIYSKFFEQMESLFNPTKDKNLKIFEIIEKFTHGTIWNKSVKSIPIIFMRYNTMERLEMVYKNIKLFTCQILKMLRYVYCMNLIGKNPNDLNSLKENRPVIFTDPSDDLKQNSIAISIKREGLDFDLAMKFRFDPKNQLLLYYTSNNLNELYIATFGKNGNDEKEIMRQSEYREHIMTIFRSINNPDFDAFTVDNQIKHMTNYYTIIQSYFKANEKDKDYQFHQQIVDIIRVLENFKLVLNFSKKDMDIPNFQDTQIQQPKYIFEISSYYDAKQYIAVRKICEVCFGRCSQNKIFVQLKNNNGQEVKYIQPKEIQQYAFEFLLKYVFINH